MEAYTDINEVIALLREKNVFFIQNPTKTIIVMREHRIFINTEHSSYNISIDEFKELYQSEVFYKAQPQTGDVDEARLKDEEYYNWSHK